MAQKTASVTIPPPQCWHRHLRMPQSYAPQGSPLACADTPDFALSPTSRHTYITASGEWSAKRLAIILYVSIHAPTWGATVHSLQISFTMSYNTIFAKEANVIIIMSLFLLFKH